MRKSQAKPLTKDELLEPFILGCKDKNHFKVGVEWEKIGVYRDTGRAITYSGKNGVEAILKKLVQQYRWQPIYSQNHIISLKRDKTFITLEPGGQIELSGYQEANLSKNLEELKSHLSEIKEISSPMGIVWLGIGVQPLSVASNIEWVPKPRYKIMRESLKNKGALTHSMMKETASVQISLDYATEKDAIEKLRLAMALSPVFIAMFANSPFEKGKISPYLSRRAHIWSKTAPERSGIIPKIFKKNFGFEDYVQYALDVPLLFLLRHDQWVRVEGIRFRDYLKKGYQKNFATMGDWKLHLTSIFTEARLKNYIEIRSIDCQKPPMAMAAVAFVKGIFYNQAARQKAWGAMAHLTLVQRNRLAKEASIKGLRTSFKNKTLWELASDLISLAEAGLNDNEARYLAPLKQIILEDRMNPAQKAIQVVGAAKKKSGALQKIIDFYAI